MFGVILCCLDLELLIKMISVSVYKPRHFRFLQIIQDLNKIKKSLEYAFVDIDK